MPKRSILGIPRPFFIGAVVFILALGGIGLLSGALGRSIVGDIGLPDWIIVESPHPQLPPESIFHVFGLAVTNTMITAWITIVVLGGIFYAATRRIKLIPSRLQVMVELVLGWLLKLCQDAAGDKNGRRFFPLVATLFLFVIANAWLSLIPGFGSILATNSHGEVVPILRGANTDINFTLALALVSFVLVEYWGMSVLGSAKYLKKFFNFGPFITAVKQVLGGKAKQGLGGLFSGAISIFVGFLEFILEFVRILSFTFRLFGNMTGGEILLLMMMFLSPFVLAVPFYGLEILVGFVQALIFGGLTLSFATIAITSHTEEAH